MNYSWDAMPRLLPGDIVLVNGVSRLSSAIKFFEKTKNEDASFSSHIATMIDERNVIEALWRVRARPLEVYRTKPGRIVVVRNTSLSMEDRWEIAIGVIDSHGRRYGVSKIIGAAIDRAIFKNKVVTRKLCRYKQLPICSLIPAVEYQKKGIKFLNKLYFECQPDDISDHALVDPDWIPVWADSRETFRLWLRSGRKSLHEKIHRLG